MSQSQTTVKITVQCPKGHRLRGGTNLCGKTIRCPKCQAEFVFAPTKPSPPENRQVTDTAVMRILGDGPGELVAENAAPADADQAALRRLSDTGVVRILAEPASIETTSSEVETRPCPRCNVPTPENAAVCEHCNTYLGVMPTFLKQLHGGGEVQPS